MDRGENSCLVEVEREGGTGLRVENPNFETIEQCSAPQYGDPSSLLPVFLLRPRNQPNAEECFFQFSLPGSKISCGCTLLMCTWLSCALYEVEWFVGLKDGEMIRMEEMEIVW